VNGFGAKIAGIACLGAIMILLGCAAREPSPVPRPSLPVQPEVRPQIKLLGYTIQAGAFSLLDNAVRLTESLQAKGLDATFFHDEDGLYKVRFGNFASSDQARSRAEGLQKEGVIDVFYIVAPDQYTASQREIRGEAYVREQIVNTAKSFMGLPYRWGGTQPETGFDCSGLTLTAYQLNGYDLPRTSLEQFQAGKPVAANCLAKGDLVFFAVHKKSAVSHVGLYIGGGYFIHAPGQGRVIGVDSISSGYYQSRFIGARAYL